MSITYKIVGKVKSPIPEGYEVVGRVNNSTVDFGPFRTVARANSRLIAKSKRCVIFSNGKRIIQSGTDCVTCTTGTTCPRDRVIPVLILE